jgi:hypothetical protein
MVEAKKAGAKGMRKGAKNASVAASAPAVDVTEAKLELALEAAPSVAPPAAPEPVGSTKPRAFPPERADALRRAVSETVSVSARGALEVNDKIIDALESQSHAALDLWRNAITAFHLPDGYAAQAQGARQAYETASAQWKDIAETTAQWLTRSLEPLQSVLHRQDR